MRFVLFEGRDGAGGPFPVVVREGEAAPSWPGLVLSKLAEHDHLEDLIAEIETRGLLNAPPPAPEAPTGELPASPPVSAHPAEGRTPKPPDATRRD